MREKLYRFMQGQYGNDQLNKFLMILCFVFLILSMFGLRGGYFLSMLCLVLEYYRMLSRNIYKRQAENTKYLQYTYKIRTKFYKWKNEQTQKRTHHIYKCPSCKQKIRVPRGRGRIEIRCPKCSTTFIKHS